ncbi:ATP-binding cassette domain-containing protein [Methanosarcina horonobensis]|uniref:ATP-binding cassette domain-containing protein n=1 Tax=Methanosarcina horonobensis TaxID=418008 RepID=UPI0022B8FBC6|nr:ABC transporter ATP-binding protein [Methanosarcina horonobensis]
MGEKLEKLLELVGLEPEQAFRYPHQLSGGELQRAVIARAIALEPALIICDEPTSMLDVSTQAAIVRLLRTLQSRLGCALLFITHDQGLAHAIGDRTAVMFGGQIVEEGREILDKPFHPFTRRITSFPGTGSLQCTEPEGTRVPGSCVYYQSARKKQKNVFTAPICWNTKEGGYAAIIFHTPDSSAGLQQPEAGRGRKQLDYSRLFHTFTAY